MVFNPIKVAPPAHMPKKSFLASGCLPGYGTHWICAVMFLPLALDVSFRSQLGQNVFCSVEALDREKKSLHQTGGKRWERRKVGMHQLLFNRLRSPLGQLGSSNTGRNKEACVRLHRGGNAAWFYAKIMYERIITQEVVEIKTGVERIFYLCR